MRVRCGFSLRLALSAIGEMAQLNPDPAGFGVYIHWPFCVAKCPYCDFNSHVRHGGVDQAAFVTGYQLEIDHLKQLVGPRNVSSIFIGGGTPSLMAPKTLATERLPPARCKPGVVGRAGAQ